MILYLYEKIDGTYGSLYAASGQSCFFYAADWLIAPRRDRGERPHLRHTCGRNAQGTRAKGYKSYSVPFKVKFLAGGKVNEKNEIYKIACLFFIIDNAWDSARRRNLGGRR